MKADGTSAYVLAILFALGPLLASEQVDSAPPHVRFHQLTVEDGMSQSSVHAMMQDRAGYMWFGTFIGLNRYDGYSFRKYMENDGLPPGQVAALLEDRDGRIWVGCGEGLAVIEQIDTASERIRGFPVGEGGIPDPSVTSLFEDRQGVIWVGTNRGLARYRPETDDFETITNDFNQPRHIIHPEVRHIFEDHGGRLLVGTRAGLTIISPERDRCTHIGTMPAHYRYRYPENLLQTVTNLEQQGAQLAAVKGDRADFQAKKSFHLQSKTQVLLVCQGEGLNGAMFDYGMLLQNDRVLWEADLYQSGHAGGIGKNRLQIALLELDAGDYELFYQTDDSHQSTAWNAIPPDRPHWWGIQAFAVPADEVRGVVNDLHFEGRTAVLEQPFILRMVEDRHQRLWLAVVGGLYRFDPEILSSDHTSMHGEYCYWSAGELKSRVSRDMVLDEDENLWLALDTGLGRFSAEDRYRHIDTRKNRADIGHDLEVVSLLVDRNNHLWVGGVEGGASLVENDGLFIEHHQDQPDRKPSLGDNRVYSLSAVNDDVIWIGTRGGVRAFHIPDRRYLPITGPEEQVKTLTSVALTSIHQDRRGGLWLGGSNYLARYPNRVKTSEGVASSVEIGVVEVIRPREVGAGYWNQVPEIMEDKDGTLWFATHGAGLIKLQYDGQGARRLTRFTAGAEARFSLPDHRIRGLYRDGQGRFWVGTFHSGLVLFNEADAGQSRRFVHDPQRPDSLSHNNISMIREDGFGRLWVATYGGGLNLKAPGEDRFLHFGKERGLPDEVVYGMLFDHYNSMWVSTNYGLARIALEGEPRVIRRFTHLDGLQSNEFNHGALAVVGRENFFFGGINGFNLLRPGPLATKGSPVSPFLTGISLFGEPHLGDQPPHRTKTLELGPDQNVISFQFTAADYLAPHRRRFRYQLLGVDHAPFTTAEPRSHQYAGLAPGTYRFEVFSVNPEGISSSHAAALRIFVRPPFYGTWWFRTLVIAILALVLSALIRLRLNGLEREKHYQQVLSANLIEAQEAERERIAAELHDSLGQNLLVINNEIQLKAHLTKEPADPDWLMRLSNLVRDAVEEVRHISYNLRPHQLDRLGLKRAVISVANQIAEVGGLEIALELDEVEGLLPAKSDIHVFRVVQEALNNVVRHADAGKVRLAMRVDDNRLTVVIEDDGVGFQAAEDQKFHGMGLKTMRERAKVLGGTLRFETQEQGGSRLLLFVPLDPRGVP